MSNPIRKIWNPAAPFPNFSDKNQVFSDPGKNSVGNGPYVSMRDE
jgi:hypothetical protein